MHRKTDLYTRNKILHLVKTNAVLHFKGNIFYTITMDHEMFSHS